ncbi:MAG: HEAT repeat domain-containing protein, partial [Melioribacteraceae bacterium]|nr:HEAT repeat domain-containing protein [Melioribacteraceae bacterium]
VTAEKPENIEDEDLLYSRSRLFGTINSLAKKPSVSEKIEEFFRAIFSNKYTFAFGTVMLVLVGLFIGYILFSNPPGSDNLITDNIIDLDEIDQGNIKISDISLPNSFSENNQFEFKLGESKPVSYRGDLNDIVVQRLLAAAINESQNPGFKIRTANIISELASNNFMPDDKIKDAFIYTLKNDNNPGVRKGALKALVNFPYDSYIRDALIFVLSNDDNASNRLDAINALLSINMDSPVLNDAVKAELENKILNEDNDVIKNKTAKLIIGGN